jgi:DNA-binding XRE family transcriptional regulator
MIHAYDENMRPKAQATLGRAFDFAAYEMGYLPSDFLSLFIESGFADRFGQGEPAVVMGMSGAELALSVLENTVGLQRPVRIRFPEGRSKEYWMGWALARYQWETGLSFRAIQGAISMEAVERMYGAYHEMDIERFIERLNELYLEALPQTNLQRIRKRAGITQGELANRSGVSVRTIQQYEQRRKDVNKAQLETAMALARALNCQPSQLFERVMPA